MPMHPHAAVICFCLSVISRQSLGPQTLNRQMTISTLVFEALFALDAMGRQMENGNCACP